MFSNYAKFYETFNRDKPYKKEIEFVYNWADKPKFLLDLGCGTANYWEYFPEECFVNGLERSEEMINIASRTKIGIFQGDILEIKKSPLKIEYDCVTALFDVINYLPRHDWWRDMPLRKYGSFIFDVFDKEKVEKDGFTKTVKTVGDSTRTITPLDYDGKEVKLQIEVENSEVSFREIHTMYLYSRKDIEDFCARSFEIMDVKTTPKWQRWYKLVKK